MTCTTSHVKRGDSYAKYFIIVTDDIQEVLNLHHISRKSSEYNKSFWSTSFFSRNFTCTAPAHAAACATVPQLVT